jgi:hypothetical protein
MIQIILGLCIFCLVLFIYLHIQFHLKTSNDLEIYEIDDVYKDKLEEILDLRQPVIFNFNNQKLTDITNINYLLNNYKSFEIKIRNINDKDNNSELLVPLPLDHSVKLFNEDKKSEYFSEKNTEFLEETGIIKTLKHNDDYLTPYMVLNKKYDIVLGSKNTCTPFKYEINYRNFFILTEGSATIKIAPPCSSKYLYTNYDYDTFEFTSPINPWNPAQKYINDFDKVKCIEYTLVPNKTLYIPAYWWYSIKFNEPNTSISCFYYGTYMSNVSNLPYLGLYALQIQNIKRKVFKKANIDNLEDNIQNV